VRQRLLHFPCGILRQISDHGVVCTLDNPVYLTRIKGKTIHCLDQSARPHTITFDPTEYRFKLALLRNNHEEMLHIIRTSTLLGQSIIAYLQRKGFPEVSTVLLAIFHLTWQTDPTWHERSRYILSRTTIPGLTSSSNAGILKLRWKQPKQSIDRNVGGG
jgi:hypothetical protein